MRFSAMLFVAIGTVTAAAAQDVHVHVDPNGHGSITSTTDYTTIQQALDHAPEAPHGRIIVHIAPGTYHERIDVTRNRPRVTLLGEGKNPEDTVVTAAQFAKQAGGTFFTETAQINGDAFEADNLTFENSAAHEAGSELGKPVGQAVAAAVRSDRAIFKNCRFVGDQDTLFADFGRQYYLNTYIEGGVDFIFGNAAAVFDHSQLMVIRNGFVTAQSRTDPAQTTGYIITNSKIESSYCYGGLPACRANIPIHFFLGRPWRSYSRVIVMNTELPATLEPAGWSLWKPDDPPAPKAFYGEFHNTGPGAATSARVSWSHQLTAAEAAAYAPQTFLRGGTADQPTWDPVAEAAKLP